MDFGESGDVPGEDDPVAGTDAPLLRLIEHVKSHDKAASFLSVRPNYSFNAVRFDDRNVVTTVDDIAAAGIWINGGFFVCRKDVFDHVEDGEDVVQEPFRRLFEQQLVAYRHEGFWAPMDTPKEEEQQLEGMLERGIGPWRVGADPAVPS